MLENKKQKYTYLSAAIGAACLMLLRVCDRASALSIILAIAGLTALIYSLRRADSKTEYISIACMMALTFAVRIYGYTGDPVTDILLGLLIGLIMFALMGVEGLLKKLGNSLLKRFGSPSLKRSGSSSSSSGEPPANPVRDMRLISTLIYPAAYLFFMYFTEIIKVNMPFRMDTYLSCLPVLCQITSIFGIYFLDFLLAWTASVIAYILPARTASVIASVLPGEVLPDASSDAHGTSRQRPDDSRKSEQSIGSGNNIRSGKRTRSGQNILPVISYLAVLCGVLCFGMVHMHEMNVLEDAKQDTLRVACASGPYIGTISDAAYTEFTMEETMTSFSSVVSKAAGENAKILVFSEEAYDVSDQDEETLLEEAQKLAAQYDMHLVLAYEVGDTDDSEGGKGINKLCWISNEGQVICDYRKHCIIPIIETGEYVRGDQNIEALDIDVDGKSLKVATAICYDADFDLFMAHMDADVDLLLLPTWDWSVIAEEHFGVARLRAICSETTLVRSAYDGWNAVIDSAGHVLARENANEIGYENVFVYDVPVR